MFFLIPNFAFGDQNFYVYKSPDPDDMNKKSKPIPSKIIKNEPHALTKQTEIKEVPKQNSYDELINLAKSGDKDAQYSIGLKLYYGQGIECNKKEGTFFLMSAAENGKYTEESLDIIINENYKGNNVPKNYIETRKWLKKSSDNDNPKAQNDLAFLFFNGLGGEVDYNSAFELYHKSAMHGYALAQANLGTMYVNGIGTKKDSLKGYAWYDIASINGNEIALNEKKKLLLNMTPNEINEAQHIATELFKTINEVDNFDNSATNEPTR